MLFTDTLIFLHVLISLVPQLMYLIGIDLQNVPDLPIPATSAPDTLHKLGDIVAGIPD